MKTPTSRTPPRVPRSRRDDFLQKGFPAPAKMPGIGWVISQQTDTVTITLLGQDLPGVIPLMDPMPDVDSMVEVESRGDLLVIINAWPYVPPEIIDPEAPTEEILYVAGAVSVTPNTWDPGFVVGGSPQWHDSLDSSYATTYLSVSGAGSTQARAYGTLTTMTTPPGDVTGLTLHVRCKTANTGAAYQRRVGFTLWNGTAGEYASFGYVVTPGGAFYQAPDDDTVHDLVIAYNGTALAATAAKLATGGQEFRAFRYSPVGMGSTPTQRYEMTVYDMWIVVET